MKVVQRSFFLIALFMVGCQKATHWDSQEWRNDSVNIPRPDNISESSDIQSYRIQNFSNLSTDSIRLQLQTQKLKGVEVEGSYYKQIVVNGKPEFVSYHWIEKFPVHLQADLLMMKASQKRVLAKIIRKNRILKSMQVYERPRLVLRSLGDSSQLYWKLLMSGSQGNLVGFYFDKNLNLIEQVSEGSAFDAKASIYPAGPLKSSLQEVVLKNLSGNNTLTTSLIKVSTQAQELAKAENNQFIFPIDDHRFEQVQVFYYLMKSLNWFDEKFRFNLGALIEAETSMGYPEKTNTAFYYQNKIRLGEGDDETYSKIALDPSVVIHESVHAVIDRVARLPHDGVGGAINEALADYFSAAQLENPLMGEASYKKAPFKRNLENSLNYSDLNKGLYHDSQVISGLLWSLRKDLGNEMGDHLAWQVLAHLTPQANYEKFQKEIQIQINTLPDEQKEKGKGILRNRGWL